MLGSHEEISIFDLVRRVRQLPGSVSAIQLIPYYQAYGGEYIIYRKPDSRRNRDCISGNRDINWLKF
jgi:hypothetical protein